MSDYLEQYSVPVTVTAKGFVYVDARDEAHARQVVSQGHCVRLDGTFDVEVVEITGDPVSQQEFYP